MGVCSAPELFTKYIILQMMHFIINLGLAIKESGDVEFHSSIIVKLTIKKKLLHQRLINSTIFC